MTIEKIDYTQTPHPSGVAALSLASAPALIESIFPAQKLSNDVFKERSAGAGQALTALGSYWKGRKPLVLTKACVLASLLPATRDPLADLEVFEMLMGMDDASLLLRGGAPKPAQIVQYADITNIGDYFVAAPPEALLSVPQTAPMAAESLQYVAQQDGKTKKVALRWRKEVTESQKQALYAQVLAARSYRELVREAKRAEEIPALGNHIWPRVNQHLGTHAASYPELIEQLGVMRFGHRPTAVDTFSGSGQIPFAAAQLGCDTYASDLNPIASLLTWAAFNVAGAPGDKHAAIRASHASWVNKVKAEHDALNVETDGNGWVGKAYLYCLEVVSPSSGWRVPVLPSLVISEATSTRAYLVADVANKRYDIRVASGVSATEMQKAKTGTYHKGDVKHAVDGVEHIDLLSAIRGDYSEVVAGTRVNKNKLRMWAKSDITFRDQDIYQERLYAVRWVKVDGAPQPATEFRGVTPEDLRREAVVRDYVNNHLADWQAAGYLPDMVIERGFNTDQPIRERGWTHWHHLFNPRQLLIFGLLKKHAGPYEYPMLAHALNWNARLSAWNPGNAVVQNVYTNQALNTLYDYGCRGSIGLFPLLGKRVDFVESLAGTNLVKAHPANEFQATADLVITDPPYGDAVKYEEILEFFIAWLRKNPPKEFAGWTWDSRRALAIKGEDHNFKLAMIEAYANLTARMPDNGIQVLMFTHQDGDIWAEMANIVWASGLRVSAAWYLVTETDSALRQGSYVKGTILLVLRKRLGALRTNQTDLAYELEEEVASQVKRLAGLNDEVAARATRPKDGNLFNDADLQMAGYAAALQVLTKYSIIDGKHMAAEALRPRIKGQVLMVNELIDFAVNTANKALLPHGLADNLWQDRNPAERFYLKMLDIESTGEHSLDNYQNFAKAFSVRNWQSLMGSEKANSARLRSAVELGRAEMAEGSEMVNTATRAVLYALMELQAEKDIDDVLAGLPHNLPNYYAERITVAKLATYIAAKVEAFRPGEASAARVLAAAIENQRM